MKTRHLGSNLGSKQQKVPANAVFAGTSMAEKEGFELQSKNPNLHNILKIGAFRL